MISNKFNSHYLTFSIIILIMVSIAFIFLSGCGSSGGTPDSTPAPANNPPEPSDPSDLTEPAPIKVTDFILEDLLSRGMPLILNFGDDSPESLDTLAALTYINQELGQYVLICSVDLAANPQGKEGYPVQVVPSQFFYTEEGKPISLPMDIDILMSSFVSVDTEEPVFTVHEGPLTVEEFLTVLDFMGVITLAFN